MGCLKCVLLFAFCLYSETHIQLITSFAPTITNNNRRLVTTTANNNVNDAIICSSIYNNHNVARLRLETLSLYSKEYENDEDEDDEDDDDEDEFDSNDPLGNGVDSVSWLPTAMGGIGNKDDITLTQSDSVIVPLFPLGGIVYTPNSEHILNIFEPRYREMYTDILMNGSKKFAVSMSHPSEPGRFATMAVLFELLELKEVSEQTGDRIKYICSHKVTGRVKLHRIINPDAWESRTTYLRVEGTIIDDSGKSTTTTPTSSLSEADNQIVDETSDIVKFAYDTFSISNIEEEQLLRNSFSTLVELQHELEEDVRFTRASVMALGVKPGVDGLWQTIKLWQSFVDQRLMSRQNELQYDFQKKLQDYLKKEKGLKGDELPSAIGFQDLSPSLQQEVKELQKRMSMELKPLVIESTLTMQKILEAVNHTERLQLVRHFVTAETKRLVTKKTIKGMFSTSGSSLLSSTGDNDKLKTDNISSSAIPPEEQLSDDDDTSSKSKRAERIDDKENASTNVQSSFFTDDDAFQ